jgi:hypothetical protein
LEEVEGKPAPDTLRKILVFAAAMEICKGLALLIVPAFVVELVARSGHLQQRSRSLPIFWDNIVRAGVGVLAVAAAN